MSKQAQGIGERAVKTADSIVDTIVLIVVLVLIAFACFALWDTNQVHKAAQAQQYAEYKPTQHSTVTFAELQKINPEVFSWLTVYGTHIDYPVVQAHDNEKYINTNALGKYSLSGALFLDAANSKDYADFNSIIYGHHMEQETMFGELSFFADKTYFDLHQYGNLFFDGKDHGLRFFAYLETNAYDNLLYTPKVQGAMAQQKYLDTLLQEAKFTRAIGVMPEDRIVLLSTCSSDTTNGRTILVAELLDSSYPDTFKTTDEKSKRFLGDMPRLVTTPPTCMVVPSLLLLAVIVAYLRARRKKIKRESKR